MQITLQPGQPVAVTVLNCAEDGAGNGRIQEISGRFAQLESDLNLEMDQAVQVEWAGHVLLGEVTSIMKTAPVHIVVVEIRHVLAGEAQAAAS